MGNCGKLGIDRELLLVESWQEEARHSRVKAKYGASYSPEPPLDLIDKAFMLLAFHDGRRIKAARHNLTEQEGNIISFSRSGLAA